MWNGDSSRLYVRKAQYKYVYIIIHTSLHSDTDGAQKLWLGLGSSADDSRTLARRRFAPLHHPHHQFRCPMVGWNSLSYFKLGSNRLRSNVSPELSSQLSVNLEVATKSDVTATVVLKSLKGDIIAKESDLHASGGHAHTEIRLERGAVDLWWPVGYGSQTLYDVEVELLDKVRFDYQCRPTAWIQWLNWNYRMVAFWIKKSNGLLSDVHKSCRTS